MTGRIIFEESWNEITDSYNWKLTQALRSWCIQRKTRRTMFQEHCQREGSGKRQVIESQRLGCQHLADQGAHLGGCRKLYMRRGCSESLRGQDFWLHPTFLEHCLTCKRLNKYFFNRRICSHHLDHTLSDALFLETKDNTNNGYLCYPLFVLSIIHGLEGLQCPNYPKQSTDLMQSLLKYNSIFSQTRKKYPKFCMEAQKNFKLPKIS